MSHCNEQCTAFPHKLGASIVLLPLQGGYRGVPSTPDSLPISIGTATSGRTTSAGNTSSSSEVGCVQQSPMKM